MVSFIVITYVGRKSTASDLKVFGFLVMALAVRFFGVKNALLYNVTSIIGSDIQKHSKDNWLRWYIVSETSCQIKCNKCKKML